MEPISLLMSHFNVENNTQITPHALAAAQDTVQGQELVKDSIRVTQTVQANEAAAEAQNVHRKTQEEEREGRRRNSQDAFERSSDDKENKNNNDKDNNKKNLIIIENKDNAMPDVKVKAANIKNFDFYA